MLKHHTVRPGALEEASDGAVPGVSAFVCKSCWPATVVTAMQLVVYKWIHVFCGQHHRALAPEADAAGSGTLVLACPPRKKRIAGQQSPKIYNAIMLMRLERHEARRLPLHFPAFTLLHLIPFLLSLVLAFLLRLTFRLLLPSQRICLQGGVLLLPLLLSGFFLPLFFLLSLLLFPSLPLFLQHLSPPPLLLLPSFLLLPSLFQLLQ